MATTADTNRGFIASRKLDGQAPGAANWYETNARNAAQIFPGDLVFLDANGEVQAFTGTSATAIAPLGVVQAVYNSNKRPLTFNQPDVGGPFVQASTAAWIAVHDDPDLVFLVNADASANRTMIGDFASVTAGAANTAAGRSGMAISVATVTATAVGHPLKIVGLGPTEIDGAYGAGNDLEVIISNHVWRRHDRNNVI